MPQRISIAKGTDQDWQNTAIPLAVGELGFATDTLVLKIGDGNTLWTNLPGLSFGINQAYAVIDDTQAPDTTSQGSTTSTLSSAQIETLLRSILSQANKYTDNSGQTAQLAMVDQGGDGSWGARGNSAVVFARGYPGRTDPPSWLTTADQYQMRS